MYFTHGKQGWQKILKLLLIEGSNERNGDKKAISEMIASVNNAVNSSILGTQQHRSNWTVNLAKDSTVANQPMINNHTCKIINNFEKILPLCVSNEEKREKWH